MKSQILRALRERGTYVSGQMLSKQLNISRVSIWKHIQGLKQYGYVVESSPVGYRLVSSPDLLLPYEFPGLEERIHYFPRVGSTMDVARELAKKGARDGTIVIAEVQTRGRGRLNREWLSPEGGIYFTLILRPTISPAYTPRINLMAAVAVASTIRKLYRLKAEVKWPNDILIAGRKVCGILAEMDAEMDAVRFVNVGIGINANVTIPQFKIQAVSLRDVLGREICRKELLGELLKEIERRQARLMGTELLEEWKGLSVTLNRDVRVVSVDEEVIGRAIDIDATGALVMETKDGSLKHIVAGDCIHLQI